MLSDRRYLKSALFFSGVMAVFFAGQAALPFLFVGVLGAGAAAYGIWFGIACIAYVAGNYATGRWGDRYPRQALLAFSALACLASALVGLAAVTLLDWSPAVLLAPTVVMSFFGAIGVAACHARVTKTPTRRTRRRRRLFASGPAGSLPRSDALLVRSAPTLSCAARALASAS